MVKKITFLSLYFVAMHSYAMETGALKPWVKDEKSNDAVGLMHVKKYIGEHALTSDFAFQENVRKADLGLQKLAAMELGETVSNSFSTNGWGQIIAASLFAHQEGKGISPDFKRLLSEKVKDAIEKGKTVKNPFMNLNVRGFSKDILMFPHQGKYFPFQAVDIKKPIENLNKFLPEAEFQFSLHEGKLFLKINPEGNDNIFKRLWKTDFQELLERASYKDMSPNKECPHITLVNSNVVAQIKEAFIGKYKEEGINKFDDFFKVLCAEFNDGLKNQEPPIVFTELNATYSEDYPPFEEVVVAKLNAPYIKKSLEELIVRTQHELGIIIPVKADSSYHLTVAVKYRSAKEPLFKNMTQLLEHTGNTPELLGYWKQLTSTNNN